MKTVVSVKNLCFSYTNAPAPAVRNISFDLQQGSYTALAGTNGSGKSTVAKIISGLIPAESGSIEIHDSSKIGIVFQSPKDQIICGTVSRDTAFGPQCLNLRNSEIELRTIESLKATGMLDYAMHNSMSLSLGQTQKIALSGILAINPDILILDEATSMLDSKAREEIFTFLEQLNEKGTTILHITHDINAIRYARNVIVMKDGEITWSGTTDSYFNEKNSDIFRTVHGMPLEKNFRNNDSSTEDGSKTVLKAEKLKFSYNRQKILGDISFSLKKGTLTALTGASGSGKTTTLELLAGLLKPQDGKIYSTERPVLCQQNSDSAIFEAFAADDVAFGPKNNGIKGRQLLELVKKSMEQVDLPFEIFASKQTCCLSGGEKRRLSLAGIIATGRDILLFDEPTAGLDGIARNKIMNLLKSLAQSGKTVLFTTHRKDEALFADKNIVIENGTVLSSEREAAYFINHVNKELKEQRFIEASSIIENFTKLFASQKAESEKEKSPVKKLPPALNFILSAVLFATSLSVFNIKLCALLLAVSFIYAAAAGFQVKKLILSMIKVIPFLMFFFIFQMIFAPPVEESRIFVSYKYFLVTASKLWMCLRILLHTESALCCICGFLSSSTENDILKGFSDLLSPLKIIHLPVRYILIMVEIIFRFIPLLADEAVCIIKTQIVRGGLGKADGFFAKIRAVIPLIVPLIIQTIKRSEILADAMTARGFK